MTLGELAMHISLKILLSTFILLSLFFVTLGLYSLDLLLLSIAILFSVASILVILEVKKYSHNPFSH